MDTTTDHFTPLALRLRGKYTLMLVVAASFSGNEDGTWLETALGYGHFS